MLGNGLALAFDAPVVAEACGLGSIAAVENFDVRIVGRGLYYSTKGLDSMLAELAVKLYSEGEESIRFNRLSVDYAVQPIDALVASLSGSRAFIGGYAFPLGDLEGYWVVAVHLRKPIRTDTLYEQVYSTGGRLLAELAVKTLDMGIEGLAEAGLALAELAGRRAEKLVKRAMKLGAEAAIVDASGSLLLALVEDEVAASMLSSSLRDLGDRFEGVMVV
jgi:hypothetical protein